MECEAVLALAFLLYEKTFPILFVTDQVISWFLPSFLFDATLQHDI